MTMTLITDELSEPDRKAIQLRIEALYTGIAKFGGTRPMPTGAPGYNKSAIEASVGAGQRYVYTDPSGVSHYVFRVTGHVRRLFTPRNGGPSRISNCKLGGTLIEYRRG